MMFGSFIEWLRRLFHLGPPEEEFIRRIEGRDYGYIARVGVPRDMIVPRAASPKTWRKPFIAEGIRSGSILLADPEALFYILLSSEIVDVVRVSGEGDYVLSQVARTSLGYGTPIYVSGSSSAGKLTVIASRGLVTAMLWEPRGGEPMFGERAYEDVSSRVFEPFTLGVSRMRERLMEWSDERFSVFVPGIDNQHRYLINSLNALYEAVVHGASEEAIGDVLTRLVRYTKFHFKSEEILMERYHYPEDRFLRHVKEHNSFVSAVTEFKERYDLGEEKLTVDVFKFLAEWVDNHIAKIDKDFGLYFKKIGVV